MSEVRPEKKIKHYQSFPGEAGSSKSFEKLKSLRFPPLANQSFLDVGCNEGFFCGFAQFMGARRIVGIDMREVFIARARDRFPDCEFLLQTWDKLPEEKFDVILLASALHYADDQEALLARLVDCLTPAGTLVLELGVTDGEDNAWKSVKRGIDTRNFATWKKLYDVLQPYAWKYVAPSVAQAGDPVSRHVLHISRRKPIAYLFMQPSGYGKTFIARSLFAGTKTPIVSSDKLIHELIRGEVAASDRLRAFFADHAEERNMGVPVTRLFAADLAADYIDCVLLRAGAGDFAFDGPIPARHHATMSEILAEHGYLPVKLAWEKSSSSQMALTQAEALASSYEAYLANGLPPSEAQARTNVAAAKKRTVANQGPLPLRLLPAKRVFKWARQFSWRQWWTGRRLRQSWRAQGTIGYVETVRLNDGLLVITGWAASPDGPVPPVFAIKFGGEEFIKKQIRTYARSDVSRSLGTAKIKHGFEVDCLLPSKASLSDIVNSLEIRGGSAADDLGPAFRTSKSLRVQTAKMTSPR